MSSPINVTWNGEAFEPANRFWATKCDQRFVVGQAYTLDEVHARSSATHAHYFAVLHDIWQSLPERMSEKFPTEEHLRKYALIRTGYRTETQHVCKTPAEAERLAAAIRPYDTYQIVTLNDLIVTVYNAVSQDMRSMDKQTFQKSKESVLDFCSELVGIEPAETRRLAGMEHNTEASAATPPDATDDSDNITSPDVVAEPAADSPAPVAGSSSEPAELSSDERKKLITCYAQFLAISDEDELDVEAQARVLVGSKDKWKREIPERLHPNLKSLYASALGVINGHDKRKAAREYAAFLECTVEELIGDTDG